jgi:hypothetical protein
MAMEAGEPAGCERMLASRVTIPDSGYEQANKMELAAGHSRAALADLSRAKPVASMSSPGARILSALTSNQTLYALRERAPF